SLAGLFYSTLHPQSLFSFHAPATTHISTLSLHDALPISFGLDQPLPNQYVNYLSNLLTGNWLTSPSGLPVLPQILNALPETVELDRKSTRLNSSHVSISYAVFCLKKKKKNILYVVP